MIGLKPALEYEAFKRIFICSWLRGLLAARILSLILVTAWLKASGEQPTFCKKLKQGALLAFCASSMGHYFANLACSRSKNAFKDSTWLFAGFLLASI